MIDIHCHIIPGIDDGADTLETSLRMLKTAQDDGIKTIFATPHFYRGRFEVEAAEVEALLNKLRSSAHMEGIDIEILQGSEVLLDKHIIDYYKEGRIRTLNGSRYLLIEFPFDEIPSYALDMIYELGLQGIVTIIAHPERYNSFIRKPHLINQFADEGCLFQLNAGSLTGFFGRDVQKTAEIFLKHGLISFLGSDAHSANRRRPELKYSFDWLDKKFAGYTDIIKVNSTNIINNSNIGPYYEKVKEKRSFINIIRR